MLAPLFVSTAAELRKKLRLTGVEAGTDADAIIDEAVVATRLRIITRLTLPRITTLLVTSYTVTPATNDEFLRALASVVETKMVRLELLVSLPTAKMDSSGDLLKRWNEEALFREMDAGEIEKMMEKLQNEIEEAMELLAGEDSAGEDTTSQVWDGAGDEETPSLGFSLARNTWATWLTEF